LEGEAFLRVEGKVVDHVGPGLVSSTRRSVTVRKCCATAPIPYRAKKLAAALCAIEELDYNHPGLIYSFSVVFCSKLCFCGSSSWFLVSNYATGQVWVG
jgi:hypothetical protein